MLVRTLHGWHAGLCVAQSPSVGILTLVVGARSLFSQMAIVKQATVPLWKVIAGPAPVNCNRARKGPVFFFGSTYCWSRPAISACHGATRRSIAPTTKLSETAISMMMMIGTKVVAVS